MKHKNVQKNFLGKLKSLKKELLEAFSEDDVRNLAELMSKLAHYHYNKKKYFMIGKEKEIYNFLIKNSYNPYTVYRWILLEKVPEDIRFQIKQKQITQKRAIALAETTIEATSVAEDELVIITGTCSQPNLAVGIFVTYNYEKVYITQETSSASNVFSAQFLPTKAGAYIAHAACQGDVAVDGDFTVGSTIPTGDPDPGTTSPSSPGSSGGGRRCTPEWSCSAWTLCNSTLEQSRSCYDAENCQANKVEVKDCDQCQESWICSLWGSCSNSIQKRTCTDQHSCGTTFVKPLQQKNCNQAVVGGSQPVSISNDIPPPGTPPAQPGFSFSDMWEKYSTYILIAGISLILIIIVVLLILHFIKPQRLAYNHDELIGWINKEREMGTSDEEIKNILANKTGWNEVEINEAFSTLSKPKLPSFSPQGNVTSA
ncbi:hypothetical protein HN419_05825 [Candidatus Woesearchaeota archaeon]|nr:hypothetical protein [Candidatus Woesearchaeota archaeon]MBT3537611.1 hypothetical protein [Candidatus Woesearchaeota archaeon]MBT4698455.1 hypothetical protein [Candidatus Woesearchaeota archaeon]MBT4716636.1 hypothetical protein [Candidatus Woesearchaeota archaeon]MBT7105280.1 hypothetical protein [Candidatus Woesearchaeota archaeon]